MVNLKVWESIVGQTVSFMKESGLMDSSTVLECGKELKGIVILENGEWEKQMAMVFMYGSMGIVMKVNSNNVLKVVKVQKSSLMETCIKVNTIGVSPMVMVNITGEMEVILREILEKVLERVMVCGRRDQELVTSTRVSIYLIKNTDMGYFLGPQGIFTKAIMKTI